MIRWGLTLLLCALILGPAQAADFVRTNGLLSDRDFYNLVACSAQPGGPCRDTLVKWPPRNARDLTVAITKIDTDYPEANRVATLSALSHAVAQINTAGAAVALREVSENPDISIRLRNLPAQSVLQGTGFPELDGTVIDGAWVQIWWNGRSEITRGVIILTPEISVPDTRSVMLEELVQSLGLLTDILNPAYRDSSIFAENSNATTHLSGQDSAVLHLHYPPL